MKVLQVNCVFRRGSTGKIVDDIHQVLVQNGIESVICYARDRKAAIKENGVYKFCTELEGDLHNICARYFGALLYGGMYLSTRKLIRIIEEEKPDIVHLHCINGRSVNMYKLIAYLGNNHVKTVVTHHAEFYYTGSCGHAFNCSNWMHVPGCGHCPQLKSATTARYFDRTASAWKKMKDAFATFRHEDIVFTAVSPWVKTRSSLSPIVNQFACEVVENGLDTNIFHQKNNQKEIRDKVGCGDKPFVFHATASFNLVKGNIKGGYYLVELAKRMPDVQFVVAALQCGSPSSLPKNVYLWGATKTQQELADLYSAADATVLVSKRETFSMITAESLCCGTPIVGFEAGGPESIALPEYSEFVGYSDLDALQTALDRMLRNSFDRTKIAEEAKAKFSKETMTDSFLRVYKNLLEE